MGILYTSIKNFTLGWSTFKTFGPTLKTSGNGADEGKKISAALKIPCLTEKPIHFYPLAEFEFNRNLFF